MTEFIPCDKCNQGYIYFGETATKCNCLCTYQQEESIRIGLEKSGIFDTEIPHLQNYKGSKELFIKLSSYTVELRTKYKKNSHLYFVGKNGTQKTYASKGIIHFAVRKGLKCRFILMNELIEKLTNTYEDGHSEIIEPYLNCDLLVIDDCFDPKKVIIYKSGYQIPYLDSFLRKRIEQLGNNTIFTSNVEIRNIDENKFSYDIKNLLTRSIDKKGGQLYFNDVYSEITEDDISTNMWK